MNRTARLTLLCAALLCGGFVAALGPAFARSYEPDEYDAESDLLWLLTGALVSLPLWAPALMPSRFAAAATGLRRVCALLLLAPTYLFSTIVTHNIRRTLSGIGALTVGITLTLACVCCVVILLWPDIRRLRDPRSN